MGTPVPWTGPPPIAPIQPARKQCNHILHFLVGFVTCGVWWLAWPFIALQVYYDNRKAENWYVEAYQQYHNDLWVWNQYNGK